VRRHAALAPLVLLFATAGVTHFVTPQFFERIVPPWLPDAPLLVGISGAAELLGACGLLLARTRRAAGWGLLALLVAVFPANIRMLQMAIAGHAPIWYRIALWVRLPLQPALGWWVWRAAIRVPTSASARPRRA
jgi:uncharacterized membrane protein